MRALLVEDEVALRADLAERLRADGFAVDACADGEEGLWLGREVEFDVAVIDLGLPGMSGMALIRTLRAAQRCFPILILTARDRWQDKVEGLEAGADDYLAKPFVVEELLARLRALLRRAAGWSQPRLQCGPLLVDCSAKQVEMAGREVTLTDYEYRIIEYLVLHPDEVISKTRLTEHLYDQDFDRDSNVIEVLMGRLRRKLDPDGSVTPISTLRGRGYRLALRCQPSAAQGGAV
jgi:two-component system response regulator PhoP